MNWKKPACAVALLGLGLIAAAVEKPAGDAHFHHVRVNSVDPAASMAYYQKFFSGVPVKFRGVADGVLTDRSFILFNKVDAPPPSELISALYHIGWGGVDGPSEYEWRDKKGAEWETELSSLGTNYFMYAYGPDREVIEVWTGFQHNRFGHVHLLSADVNAATTWYADNLGLRRGGPDTPKPPLPPEDIGDFSAGVGVFRYLWANSVSTDNCTINIFGMPGPEKERAFWWNYDPIQELVPTEGRSINHIAFSFRNIEPVFDKMKANGVEIIDEIKHREDFNMKSFLVRGPDNVLIEVVEAKPLPEGLWD